ncbi:unnamed protein product [Microthlaspi erraticum]|uniref:F-box domain-containing protein n=1 Tax=Microthlaspi erraticum TaxID=1685480 RepID=A0A6D2JS26_9BRAS|nr:unnamed protein product [Microthlaspi erraticum]
MFSVYLPSEVILKILSLLPGKTLPKLRLVSKQFNSIISEPYFLRLHHRFALNSFYTLTAIAPFHRSLIVELKFLLSTNETTLSTLTSPTDFQEPLTKQFLGNRILPLTITPRSYKHHLEIFPWTSQEQECPYLLQPYPPVHADGFLYWTTKDVPTKIVSFSLEQEKFSVLPPPPCFQDSPNHDFSLCGMRGNLWVVDYNSLEPNIEIWMMSAAWTKTHRIVLKETLTRYYHSFPIKIHDIQSDCVLFQVLLPSRMKIYHTSNSKVEDLWELGVELQLCHYTDGLLSL